MPSGIVSERHKSGGGYQCTRISETHEDMHPQFRSAGHIPHQVSHAGNERTDDEYPPSQVLEPLLDSSDLLIVYRKPPSVSPNDKITRGPAQEIAHRQTTGAADCCDGQ